MVSALSVDVRGGDEEVKDDVEGVMFEAGDPYFPRLRLYLIYAINLHLGDDRNVGGTINRASFSLPHPLPRPVLRKMMPVTGGYYPLLYQDFASLLLLLVRCFL